MKKLIALGTLSIAAISCGLIISDNSEEKGAYHERTSNFVQTATGANHALEERMKRIEGFSREDYNRIIQKAEAQGDRAELGWIEHGPDNVGGRTRAIVIDRDDINHIWAGSVSGGLFESINRGNTWTKVESFTENLGISGMCQTPNGTLWVATGHQQEQVGGGESSGLNGEGLFMMEADGSFTQISGTTSYSYINEVRSDTINNWVWIACNQGLKKYDPVTETLEDIDTESSGPCTSLSVSPDGEVLVAGIGSTTKTNVSTDGGATFLDYSSASSNTANPIDAGAQRIEYAISHEKVSGKYHVFASAANSLLQGVWMSQDNGLNWTRIAPTNDGSTPGSFAPFDVGGGGQGRYDNVISVVPGNPNRIILGGIDLYTWSTTGNWTQVSQWFLGITNPKFVHADNHELVWDKWGRLYIGNDGGVFFSKDAQYDEEPSFTAANRGYNVTQFYHSSFSAHGDVIGGSQDNGTQANYHTNSTWRESDEVGGGDGFGCEMSFINRNILFGSVYYSSVFRSSDRGQNTSSFYPSQMEDENGCVAGSTAGDGCGGFNTRIALWEDPDDENSEDSVSFIPSQAYAAGSIVEVPSETSQILIEYVTPDTVVFDDTVFYDPSETTYDTIMTSADPSTDYNSNLVNYTVINYVGGPGIDIGDSAYLTDIDTTIFIDDTTLIEHYWGTNPERPGKIVDMFYDTEVYAIPWDTLFVQDRFQSWFALANSSEVYLTRNALRFSSDQDWVKAVDTTGLGFITCLEFSRSGDHLWIGTSSGLWRLSGFNSVYSPGPVYPEANRDTLIDFDKGHYATDLIKIGGFSGTVYGISTGGNGTSPDDEHVIVATGGGGGRIWESNNGAGIAPSFTSISDTSQPYYSCVIDRDDPDLMFAGAETGVWMTENGGADWENVNGGFGYCPVYDMGQVWRSWDEGAYKPGSIYIGTFGRGIWSTDEYMSLPEAQDNLDKNKFVPNINIYPNPMTSNGTIEFDLDTNSDVNVHIFSLTGKLVRTIKENGMQKGNNNITFDASSLPRGTYIVRLTAGEQVETSKFIKR